MLAMLSFHYIIIAIRFSFGTRNFSFSAVTQSSAAVERSPNSKKWTPAKPASASGAPTRREARRLKTAPALRAAVQNLARPLRSRPFNTGVVRSTERLPCIALASSSPTPGIHSPANVCFTVRHTNLPAAYCSVVYRAVHPLPSFARARGSVGAPP